MEDGGRRERDRRGKRGSDIRSQGYKEMEGGPAPEFMGRLPISGGPSPEKIPYDLPTLLFMIYGVLNLWGSKVYTAGMPSACDATRLIDIQSTRLVM
jgi:hypothetical protein